jgi:hypothetical protein|tara:strand:+ start:2173 stop:2460 length:288 start_codon:yes stop_codon:yes gene_type:complete
MTITTTHEAAEFMLATGHYYTTRSLSEVLNISALRTKGWLYNIRRSGRYEVIEGTGSDRKMKVIAIDGRSNENLASFNMALLMKRPPLLVNQQRG